MGKDAPKKRDRYWFSARNPYADPDEPSKHHVIPKGEKLERNGMMKMFLTDDSLTHGGVNMKRIARIRNIPLVRRPDRDPDAYYPQSVPTRLPHNNGVMYSEADTGQANVARMLALAETGMIPRAKERDFFPNPEQFEIFDETVGLTIV